MLIQWQALHPTTLLISFNPYIIEVDIVIIIIIIIILILQKWEKVGHGDSEQPGQSYMVCNCWGWNS